MSARLSVPACVAVALMLSACAATSRMLHPTTPDPLAAKAAAGLAKLKADPQVAQRAPDALLDAVSAVKAAQTPEGGPGNARYLAFVAEKRVQIARALTDASENEDAYKALVARRDALGGGNETITTLSQTRTPVTQPAPTAIGPSTPLPVPAPEPPAAVASAIPPVSPPPPPLPTPPAEEAPVVSGASGALLTLTSTDFTGSGGLSPAARNAVHDLLPSLVRQPSDSVIIAGAVPARVATVRKALAALGVPAWRLQTRSGGSGVEVRFGSAVSTP